ncbi:hypothetical protein DQ04_00521050 [Trypanosoma grayi]|uniref:hypothetical protein n=1 Tax=Trypanosoma grayi TaxID=71804 RepID=UPI0004F4A991|nr:hypothetical protein DQ04_00521050 [Trypanosoma grayi]KEG14320.1 hypothetical protein DQ04_00521050 [Trypanosoma grayi]
MRCFASVAGIEGRKEPWPHNSSGSMSALLPKEAVALLYRRYLKAANRIPNVTIRMLLLQQIRSGFRRNQGVTSPSAQRELVSQAHKDLQVLEDDRLSRTLYINRLGLVSCLDWEVRRTEYNFTPETQYFLSAFLFLGFLFIAVVVTSAKPVEVRHPELSKMVGGMAMRLEADSPDELRALRERQLRSSLEQQQHRLSLEQRVLATFHEAPNVKVSAPSLRNPDGVVRYGD